MKEIKQLKFYYFAFESIYDPIFESQVLTFLKKINKRPDLNNKVKLIILGSINDLFKNSYAQKKKNIREELNNKCIFTFKFPYLFKIPYLFNFSIALNTIVCFLILIFGLKIRKSESILCHCRTEIGSYILLRLKKVFYKNIKIICDCRGIASKEIIYKPDLKNKELLSRKINKIERFTHINSDYLFCVTKTFKKYILDESKNEIKKIKVVPCCLDTNKFKYSPYLRVKIRKEMGIKEDDFVVLYSGSLNKWQLPTRMVEIFRIIYKIVKNSVFVMLTQDIEDAHKLFVESDLEKKSFIIRFEPYYLINKYLLVGDIGLLIREDNDVNRVAFPVKFSEYIRCGVPLLSSISSDVINMIEDYDLGFKLENYNDNERVKKIAKNIKKNMVYFKSDENKNRISNIIKEKVDWDYYVGSVVRIYKNLL